MIIFLNFIEKTKKNYNIQLDIFFPFYIRLFFYGIVRYLT